MNTSYHDWYRIAAGAHGAPLNDGLCPANEMGTMETTKKSTKKTTGI
ncbi:MAG: hypothetical protein AAF362_20690 [Pseudomonadota bacterium]